VFYLFLPFFDSEQFIKLLQILDVNSDSLLSYFYQFSLKAIKLTKGVIAKFLSRNDGSQYEEFSKIMFEKEQVEPINA